MRFISGVLATLAVIALLASAFIYGGWYNVAAINPEHPVLAWVMHTTMQTSVHRHASGIEQPIDLKTRASNGFQDFDEMCVQCHGAPGIERGEVGKGLRPQPPSLAKAAQSWTPSEMFWIVKNGIHMTGMPAFGPTHDDDRLWDIVAFVSGLPTLTPDDYNKLRAAAGEHHEHPDEQHEHAGHHHH
jgi:mono/diheme cytochrome c family protein